MWQRVGVCVRVDEIGCLHLYVECVFPHRCTWVYVCVFACVCLPVLALQIQSLCIYSTCVHVCVTLPVPVRVGSGGGGGRREEVSSGCLGARGAGGALQGGLGEASGEGSDAGVCQRGGREQLVPAADCGRQVQVLQEDLGHSHEALVVHTPVIPPHYYLEEG